MLRLDRNPDPDPDILPFSCTIEANPYATQRSRMEPISFLSEIIPASLVRLGSLIAVYRIRMAREQYGRKFGAHQ